MQTFTPQRASVQPKIRADRRRAAIKKNFRKTGEVIGFIVLGVLSYLVLVGLTV